MKWLCIHNNPLLVFGWLIMSAIALRASTDSIVRFDISPLRASTQLEDPIALRRFYDETMLVTSLQGLANRSEPSLLIRYNPLLDDFWNKLSQSSGSWLHGKTIQDVTSLQDLLTHFRDVYKGAVVYDERVPATSNIAVAVAGADDLLVLRYDEAPNSLYHLLTTGPNAITIKVKLLGSGGTPLFVGSGMIPDTDLPSTGSAKNDAYRWLIANYLKKGKINPTVLGYYIDSFWLKCWRATHNSDHHTLNNLDYIIANRGLVFDLDVFDDEVPVDDPTQKPGTDFATLRLILATCNELTDGKQILTQFGFDPWAFKYTSFSSPDWSAGGKHEPVSVEWRDAAVISAYNGVIDADALSPCNLTNASFYQHQPLPAFVAQQNPRPSKEILIERGILNADGSVPNVVFYAYYVGDYDSTAWLYANMPSIWSDAQRGVLPLSWAIDPNLAMRFPLAMLWMRATASQNDYFISGDSGAGYLNPSQLTAPRRWSNLPSGVSLWEDRNARLFRQWDLNVTGFVIEGEGSFMRSEALKAYTVFSPGGMCTQLPPPVSVYEGMPMLRIPLDLPNAGDMEKAACQIKEELNRSEFKFIPFRSILWKPSDFVALEKDLNRIGTRPRKLVDIPTLLWLAKYTDKSTNGKR